MLIELFVFFEGITIILFVTSFFTKQEILWALTAVFSGFLMFNSFNIETYVYQYNMTTSAYYPVIIGHSYPYFSGLNMIFLSLAIVLGLFDMFEKYGGEFAFKNLFTRIRQR